MAKAMTNDFEALWASCLAAPRDQAPKLVLADWLAERGEDPDLEAGLRLCAYHGTFPHRTSRGSWMPDFPWRWGTGPYPTLKDWPDSAIPPQHLLDRLMDSNNGLGVGHNRTVHHDPIQLVRWLAWAAADCQKENSPGQVATTH
jgi:uncharacterized protein (TIGR02996 family)